MVLEALQNLVFLLGLAEHGQVNVFGCMSGLQA